MYLLAVGDAVWMALIVFATLIVKEYFDRQRARDAAAKVEEVKETAKIAAENVEDVVVALHETTALHVEAAEKQNDKLIAIATDIHKVELATNSMKDALILATEKEALARGAFEEKTRTDAAKLIQP